MSNRVRSSIWAGVLMATFGTPVVIGEGPPSTPTCFVNHVPGPEDPPATACGTIGDSPSGCPIDIVADGDCHSTEDVPCGGRASRTQYDRTCRYYHMVYDPVTQGCVRTGDELTYVKECERASGDNCTPCPK